MLVPPTPVTNGCEEGSSTARAAEEQSSEPASPDAATTDCPWAAACSNRVFSATMAALPWEDSQAPHEVTMTWAVSPEMMAL